MQSLLTSSLLLLSLTSYTSAQVTGFGACPSVPTQGKLDVNKYLGLWYEIERFPAIFEGDNCGTANYTLNDQGNIKVVNGYVDEKGAHTAVGEAKQVDPTVDEAALEVKFSNVGPAGDYRVVETDYDNYSLVFSCRDLAHIVYAEFAWILTRDPQPDPNTISRLKTTLASYNVDVSKFQVTNQTGCPLLERMTGVPKVLG